MKAFNLTFDRRALKLICRTQGIRYEIALPDMGELASKFTGVDLLMLALRNVLLGLFGGLSNGTTRAAPLLRQ